MRCARLGGWSGVYLRPRNPRIYTITKSSRRALHLQSPQPCRPSPCARRESRRWLSQSADGRSGATTDASEQGIAFAERARSMANTYTNDRSPKLAALHARLSLPGRLPLSTLARCLKHQTADSNPSRNNTSLALLGQELIAHYTSEWLICHYPRLPMAVLFAAQYAYSGDKTLMHMTREWGVEAASAPGPGVDPGYLQFGRIRAGNAMADDEMHLNKHLPDLPARVPYAERTPTKRGMSSRIVNDDEFGDIRAGIRLQDGALGLESDVSAAYNEASAQDASRDAIATAITHEAACASFIRAVFGALYLHSGAQSVAAFHKAHILSRHLELHKLFAFRNPAQDLVRLCDRERMEPPVARLISETGRKSRTPVFVVGVFSGNQKLGEDAGASLQEGRVRAAANALRAWYLYSPPKDQIMLPSQHTNEATNAGVKWLPQYIDAGEIVA